MVLVITDTIFKYLRFDKRNKCSIINLKCLFEGLSIYFKNGMKWYKNYSQKYYLSYKKLSYTIKLQI
jgi:hypothetical protein